MTGGAPPPESHGSSPLVMIPLFLAGGVAAARETGAGIAQRRILLVTVTTWFVLIAMRLRSNAKQTAAARA